MTKRLRDQSSYWEDVEPVSNIRRLLDLLKPKEEGDFRPPATRYLHPKQQRPEVVVKLHDAGEGEDPFKYYEVRPSVAKQAVDERLVEFGASDERGIYRFDDRRCVLGDRGKRLLEYIDKAEDLLAGMGIYVCTYRAWGGVNSGTDKPYVEFETRQEERVRVYPDSGEIVTVSDARKCA